jgi:hypothetical protein
MNISAIAMETRPDQVDANIQTLKTINRPIQKQTPATIAIKTAFIDRSQQSAMGWFIGLKRDFITLKPPRVKPEEKSS